MSDDEAQLDRAQALLDLGRAAAARNLIAKVLAAAPADGRALCLLACSHEADGDHPGMLAAADRAVAAEPDDEWAHRLRTIALLQLDQPDEALRSAREAVRLAPQTWQGQVALAGALADVGGQRRAAFAAARRAVALAPDEAETHYAQGVLRHYLGFGWWARRSYLRALRCDPQHAGALTRLGQIHARGGRVADAVRHFQAAAVAAPTAVDLVAQVDQVLLRVPTWAVVMTLPVALALTAGVQPLAWVLAVVCVATYAARAFWVYRRLPVGLRPLLWSRLRQDMRYQVRIWCAAGNLVVAIGLGVASALTLSRDNPDPVVFLVLVAVALVAFGLAVAAVKVVDWFARTGETRTGPGPADLDDPDAVTGAGNHLLFRWFRAACVTAFAMIASGSLDASWSRRASYGAVAIVGYALFLWFRRPKRATWRDRRWERSPKMLTYVFGSGIVVTIGYVVTTMVVPAPGGDVQMLFLTFSFLSLLILAVTQVVWWCVQLAYGVRLLRARTAAPASPEEVRRA